MLERSQAALLVRWLVWQFWFCYSFGTTGADKVLTNTAPSQLRTRASDAIRQKCARYSVTFGYETMPMQTVNMPPKALGVYCTANPVLPQLKRLGIPYLPGDVGLSRCRINSFDYDDYAQ
jgi:hypothetical protein